MAAAVAVCVCPERRGSRGVVPMARAAPQTAMGRGWMEQAMGLAGDGSDMDCFERAVR